MAAQHLQKIKQTQQKGRKGARKTSEKNDREVEYIFKNISTFLVEIFNLSRIGSPTRIRTLVYGFGDRYTNHCAMGLSVKSLIDVIFLYLVGSG